MAASDESELLREQAGQARELAGTISDGAAVAGLLRYAEQLEAQADELEAKPVLPNAAAVPSGEPSIGRAGAALKPEAPVAESEPLEDEDGKA
jgi:hypothetical protein